MKSVFVLAFVTFIALCGGLTAPACVCDRRECEYISEIDCPGLGIVVWDPCKYVHNKCSFFFLWYAILLSHPLSIFDWIPRPIRALYWISFEIYVRDCSDTYMRQNMTMIVLTKRRREQIGFRIGYMEEKKSL